MTALVGAGGVYLLHHNRNQIVNYLTGELHEHSNINIDIAKTSIGFRHGITFDMLDIHARSESGHFDLKAPRVQIKLEFLPLLKGEIISTQAELREPEIVWTLAANTETLSSTADESSSTPPARAWAIRTDTLSFILSTWRHIVCSDASITIYPGEHAPLKFDHANLSLTQAGIDTPLQADLSGEMHTSAQEEPMYVHMKTRLKASSSEHTLSLPRINSSSSVRLRSINAAEANKYLPASWDEINLEGRVEFEASLEGSLAQGLDIVGSIHSTTHNGQKDPLQINYTGSTVQPGDAEFSGTLTYLPENGFNFSAVELDSALARVQGSIRLTPEEKHADIIFSSAPVSYAQLRPWAADLPPALEERLHGGQIACTELHYSGQLNPPVPAGVESSSWTLKLPALIRTEYAADRENTPQITLEQSGKTLEVISSALEWNGESFSAKAVLDLRGEWNAQDECFSASVDLTQSSAEGFGFNIKKQSSPAQLNFTFRPHSQGWEISDATLETPEINATCSAESDADSGFSAHFNLTQFNLNSLRTRIPILDFMELGGKVDLNYSLQRQNSSWSGNGILTLHDCSIYPVLILGRIHHVNGEAHIEDLSINAPELDLQLGENASPMRASVSIADLRQPVADIRASGDEVVA
ncbi:MAG: hypothetical protein LC645_01145, partial [Geobacteraceae bacterium]|nr:hypothetical protein [Geobacteraceae bacterium]